MSPESPRKTGLSTLTEIPWGTHFCHFYETKQDLLDLLVPYFKAGLENNEYCVCVSFPPVTETELHSAMRASMPDFDRHLIRRSFDTVAHDRWYMTDGLFDGLHIIEAWKDKLDEALRRGYAGMRAQGNEGWLTDTGWLDFLSYEKQLNRALVDLRLIVMCTYPLTRSAGEIFDVAHVHEFAVAKRDGHWEVLETPEVKRAKADLLAEKTALEHRVHETARHLASAAEEVKQEVAERKRAQRSLREREQEFRTVVENTPDQIIRYDRQLRRIFVNRAASTAFEASLGQPAGSPRKDGRIFATADEIARLQGMIRSVFESGKPHDFEMTWPSVSGRRTFSVRMAPEFDLEGDVASVLAVARDITELKAAEDALRQSQAELARVARVNVVGELTASLAHELNQPLAGVVSNADACLRWLDAQPPNFEEARRALHRIVRDGNRASNVVSRTRAFLKKGEPVKAPFKVEDLIVETIALVQDEMRRRHVELRTHVTPGLPLVNGDRVQVQQVLLNLLMNACDAMGEVTDRPRQALVNAELKPADTLRISIEDSGVGIDSQQRERLFAPFYTTKPNGLGMGLSISHSIIEAHGGRIWAEAGPQGARFIFTLPVLGRAGR